MRNNEPCTCRKWERENGFSNAQHPDPKCPYFRPDAPERFRVGGEWMVRLSDFAALEQELGAEKEIGDAWFDVADQNYQKAEAELAQLREYCREPLQRNAALEDELARLRDAIRERPCECVASVYNSAGFRPPSTCWRCKALADPEGGSDG